MLKHLVTFNAESKELNRFMDMLDRALNPVFNNILLDANIVKSVNLVSGDNLVDHKLGRNPIGWIITRQRGAANIYDKQDSNATPSKNFILNSSAAVTVDIYFF